MFYLWGLIIIFSGGLAAIIFAQHPQLSAKFGALFATIGLLLCGIPAFQTIQSDFNSFFKLPIIFLGIAGAIHSIGYLKGHHESRIGFYWFFYNLTLCAMLGVTLCTHKLGFLVLWEIMGLASFALVAFDYDKKATARAAWIYLLACQAGSMFLIPMFIFSFDPNIIFILAVLGFGLKIGFPLLHIWLPEAHPAAPAPVSALMSGAMIQLGFLGIFRWSINYFENTSMVLSGWILLTLGIIGATCGILFAMGQNNLKKLLAWSSIENMGIIAIGFGLGLLGLFENLPEIAYCAFAGSSLHLINHALLKGGLFLGAGSIQKATGSLEIDDFGGLLQRMPKTGTCFILNAIGLSGLPPFNGFISEFLIYLAALIALSSDAPILMLSGIAVLIAMALTGGLAAATFIKAIGGTFLGEPRSNNAMQTKELPLTMVLPLWALLVVSGIVVLLAPMLVAPILGNGKILHSLTMVCAISLVITILSTILFYLRAKTTSRHSVTWDCGYAAPTARMEYTGSAIIQPLTDFFRPLLRPKRKITIPIDKFPNSGEFTQEFDDPGMSYFWAKIFAAAEKIADKVHFLQSGYLHFYILIITAVLLLMLVWGLILPWSGTLIKGVN